MVLGVVESVLPPRLGALLALDADPALSARLQRVLEAGSRAIGQLGHLELVKYEDSPVDATADLSMWEEMAPVVGNTIADVNALVAEMEVQFPLGELSMDDRESAIEETVQNAATELKQMITEFGMAVRDPSVVSDRWNLIAELQSFRFKFRDRIGSMVFELAQRLGDCTRAEVDPGFEELLTSTLVVRQTTADLRRLMRARIHKVSEAPPEEVEANALQIEKELNAFGRTAAWRVIRAQDKKTILEFRGALRTMTAPGMSKMDLLMLLEPFVEFVDAFEQVNDREMLIQHDRDVMAQVGVVLERAMNALNHEEAVTAFTEAVAMGQMLYGRSSDFDTFLRKLRKSQHTPDTLKNEVEQFLILLAGMSVF